MENSSTKEVAVIDTRMLDAAVSSGGAGYSSVMDDIHTVKIYNPPIGENPDPAQALTFKVKTAVSGEETNWNETFSFNPVKVNYFYSGSIYPIDENGLTSDDKVFFTTSEFGKFAKKTDTIGLSANGQPVGFFTKGDFEAMIRTPMINGKINQFYERKKDSTGKPYDASQLVKRAVIYGKIIGGEHDGEHFRFITSTKNLGITWTADGAVDPEFGTFEYAVREGLDSLNKILESNKRKPIKNCPPEQVIIDLGIKVNERGNFLPDFRYNGLMIEKGLSNFDSIELFEGLTMEHFQSIFGSMQPPAVLEITSSNVTFKSTVMLNPPKKDDDKNFRHAVEQDEMTFGKIEDLNKPVTEIDINEIPF